MSKNRTDPYVIRHVIGVVCILHMYDEKLFDCRYLGSAGGSTACQTLLT